jgi:casein kinase 1
MLIYFLKGSLPWQNLKNDPNYDRYEKILEKKLSVSIETLTQGIPEQFYHLVEYTRGLHFIEEPNYDKIRSLLDQAYLSNRQEDEPDDDLYSWEREEQL